MRRSRVSDWCVQYWDPGDGRWMNCEGASASIFRDVTCDEAIRRCSCIEVGVIPGALRMRIVELGTKREIAGRF